MSKGFKFFGLLGLFAFFSSLFSRKKKKTTPDKSYTPRSSDRDSITYTPINRSNPEDQPNTDNEWTEDGAG